MANDPKLGAEIQKFLKERNLENPIDPSAISAATADPYDVKRAIEYDVKAILTKLGLDLNNDSIQDTPKRVAKMYCDEIFSGLSYDNFPQCTLFKANNLDEVISVVDIEVRSTCEHHLLPFLGSCTVAYIPSEAGVLGLSKFNRIVDFFSRRPQLQERLTAQILTTLGYILRTEDIATVIRAEHLCTKMRGIKDFKSFTVTSKLSGKFRRVPELRNEFLSLTANHH